MMAKQGMKRPNRTHNKDNSSAETVPMIQGKAKNGKEHVNPIITGTAGSDQKVYHTTPYSLKNHREKSSHGYVNDLARDNEANDLPAADLQDLESATG